MAYESQLSNLMELAKDRSDYYLFHNNLPFPRIGDSSPSLWAKTDNDGAIVVSEEFFSLPIPHQLGVIAHERMHLVFDTIPRGKAHNCDKSGDTWRIWNIAADAFINDLLLKLGYDLPRTLVYLSDLEDKYRRKFETSEDLYDFLLDHQDDMKDDMSDPSSVTSPIPKDLDKKESEFGDNQDNESGGDVSSGEGEGEQEGNASSTGGEGTQNPDGENESDNSDNNDEEGENSLEERVKEFKQEALEKVNFDPDNCKMNWSRSELKSGRMPLGSILCKVKAPPSSQIISTVINRLNSLNRSITERTYARLNRRCPTIKGERRSTLPISIVLDVSGSMWKNHKLDNAAALSVAAYAYLSSLGYRIKSYLLDTGLTEIKSMTYKEMADGSSSGGTDLVLVEKIKGVRILITDACDSWVVGKNDRDTILVYDGPERPRGIRCDFSTGRVIKDKR